MITDYDPASGHGFRQHLIIALARLRRGLRRIRLRKHHVDRHHARTGVKDSGDQARKAVAWPGPAAMRSQAGIVHIYDRHMRRRLSAAGGGYNPIFDPELQTEQKRRLKRE
jgi:hypothetical protein